MSGDNFGIDKLGDLAGLFGPGPDFNVADSEIISIKLDRNLNRGAPSLTMHIWAYEFRRATYQQEITLRFEDIFDLVLDDFNHQNVLSCVQFSECKELRWADTEEPVFRAEWHSKFGASLSFTYKSASVVFMSEKTPFQLGQPQLDRK